ncbi:MAG: hypothetical protein QE271_05455 [Bacteriovoracaceae bacterium]|nr:hypothetical protein [Bacteriovoracaceae bacterium]
MKNYYLCLAFFLVSTNSKAADLWVYIDQLGHYNDVVQSFIKTHPNIIICPTEAEKDQFRIPEWNFIPTKDIFAYCVQNSTNNSAWISEYNSFVGNSESDVTIIPVSDGFIGGYVEPGYYGKCNCLNL